MSLYFHFFIVASPHDGVIVSDFVGVDETSSVKERDGAVVSILMLLPSDIFTGGIVVDVFVLFKTSAVF